MRRVLDRNGRLALSVWNNVGIYTTAEAGFLATAPVGSTNAFRKTAARRSFRFQ
jgi:hypothetical protein